MTHVILPMLTSQRSARRHLLRTLSCLALSPSAGWAADAPQAVDGVIALPGELPLLLTVPHDGTEPMGAWPTRSPGAISRDAGTRPLAERVADVLRQRLGRRPALVIETYTRKHMDVNRAEAEAFERPEAQPAYRAYHAQVAAAVATLRARCPQGALLLDVHGQSDEPGTVFLGTRAGLTTRALLQRHGIDALHGPNSVIGQLAARGHTVNPPAGSPSLKEDPRFAGGHTVFSYGSQQPEGIDAIQLEFGRSVRAQPGLAEDVAEALQGFMTHYGLLTR